MSTKTCKKGTLFIVATPIGNMDDITKRALDTLATVDLIAAEDTRKTRRLLTHHQIKAKLISYHEHNESQRTPRLLKQLREGTTIALVSTAGTPMVSDPGYRLVAGAIAENLTIVPIPGVSALVTALCVAGLPTDAFVFCGFPSKKKPKRIKRLEELAKNPQTIIFYESPRRIVRFIEELVEVMGDRQAVLCRELTKSYEEIIRGQLNGILHDLRRRPDIKGECTLLISGKAIEQHASVAALRDEIIEALETMDCGASGIAKKIAQKHGIPKDRIYAEVLDIKKEGPGIKEME